MRQQSRQIQDKQKLHKLFSEALRPFMRNVPDPELSVYMMGIALHAIIHSVTADRPELLRKQILVDEVMVLFENYLCRSNGALMVRAV